MQTMRMGCPPDSVWPDKVTAGRNQCNTEGEQDRPAYIAGKYNPRCGGPDAACMGGECAIAAFMGLSFAVENALHTRLYGGFHLGG